MVRKLMVRDLYIILLNEIVDLDHLKLKYKVKSRVTVRDLLEI